MKARFLFCSYVSEELNRCCFNYLTCLVLVTDVFYVENLFETEEFHFVAFQIFLLK